MYIDLPRRADITIDSFSHTMFVMATELDKGFPFSSRRIRVKGKKEKFDWIRVKLPSTFRSSIFSWAVFIDKASLMSNFSVTFLMVFYESQW